MKDFVVRYAMVALSLVGSAILLFSCENTASGGDEAADEALMTEFSEDLTVVMSQNGRRSYIFETPLLEGYSQAREPYREFRKGVKITTYQDDSLSTVDAVLTANYAIYYQDRELWEAKGDVVIRKYDGKTLYTQQLFWNARTKRIYSNVDSRIVQPGRQDNVGQGFESDEEFRDWRFRFGRGRMEIDVKPRDTADSLQQEESGGAVPVSDPSAGDGAAPGRPERAAAQRKPAPDIPAETLSTAPAASQARAAASGDRRSDRPAPAPSASERSEENSRRPMAVEAVNVGRVAAPQAAAPQPSSGQAAGSDSASEGPAGPSRPVAPLSSRLPKPAASQNESANR